MNDKKKIKVIVGMSGGVDSSVSAALLKEQGFLVSGIFLKMWKADGKSRNQRAFLDAKKIAKILDIPFKVIDIREKFKKEVVGYFLNEYANGCTPNPCIFCNENFKYKILFEEKKKSGADYIATGHYAQIIKKRNYKLFEARDKNKDQSYFLYRLNQNQLSKIIFPLGKYKKEEVRKIAKKFKLPNFEKEESQDICFLGNLGVAEFLKKYLPSNKKGNIVNEEGEILGEHSGLSLYTIGQRKGINIGGKGPFYVFKKDQSKNEIVITNNKKDLSLFSSKAILKEVNWILKKPKLPIKILARSRYRNPLVYATIKPRTNVDWTQTHTEYMVEFEKLQRAITSGQSVVFYSKNGEVIGGGIIK